MHASSSSHCNIAWFMLKIIRLIMLNGYENVHPIIFVYNWFQDKEADFSASSGVGVRNTIYALLLSGLYEVLIEFNISLAQFEYVASPKRVLRRRKQSVC